MVIISEITSVFDVIVKATIFVSRIPEKWYKKGSEIEKFRSNLSSLSCSSSRREHQLQLNGMSEHPTFKAILAEAVRLLDAEIDYHEKHRKSWGRTLKRRPFPSQLTHILSDILSHLQAGPEQLAKDLDWHALLTKRSLLDASPLPFSYDLKYVPLQGTVHEVQRALEDKEGRQVVTLYGAPGTGKSSLAKFVGLNYQDSIQGSASCPFDGVQYLLCPQGCRRNAFQLQKALFSNLGLGTILEEGQDGDHNSSSFQGALRRVLEGRRMLIILDDVWREDFEALATLICLGTPSKYLLTSQTKDVWPEACFIQMAWPTREEALEMFDNHLPHPLQRSLSSSRVGGNGRPRTSLSSDHQVQRPLRRSPLQGLSCDNALCISSGRVLIPFYATELQENIVDIIKMLESHPLSLINVAMSMSSDGLADADQLESLTEAASALLDEARGVDRFFTYERVYPRVYSHNLSTSMILIIESLRRRERNLLFLITLLHGTHRRGVPEHLVRFFMRRFCDGNPSQSTFEYISALSFLEDNSLVQVNRIRRQAAFHSSYTTFSVGLTTHNLRREIIRRKLSPALLDVASSLVGSRVNHYPGDLRDQNLLNVRDAGDVEQDLAVVFAATYFDQAFTDEIAVKFRSLTNQINEHLLPRGLEQEIIPVPTGRDVVPGGFYQGVDAQELIKSTKHLHRRLGTLPAIGILTELLEVDGEELWRRQVYSDAGKMIMKMVCKQQLDDESMASLLSIPYSADAACRIFSRMYERLYRKDLEYGFHYGRRKTLSGTLPATWRALLNLLYSEQLRQVIHLDHSMSKIIEQMFEFEPESAMLPELQKLRQLVDQSSDPRCRHAVHTAFIALHGSRLSFEMLNGMDLQDFLPSILRKLIHDIETVGATETIYDMSLRAVRRVRKDRGYVKILLRFPASCEELLTNASLFRRVLSLEQRYTPEQPLLLGVLSGTPEFRAEATRVLAGDCWKAEGDDFTLWPESYGVGLACFWGNIALLQGLHITVRLRLEKISEHLAAKLSEYRNSGHLGGDVCHFCSLEHCINVSCRNGISSPSVTDVARAVTIIRQIHASPPFVTSAPLEGSPKEWMNSTCLLCMEDRWHFYVRACWGQAQAYQQMEMYAESLHYLEMVQMACDICPNYFLSSRYSALRDPIQGDLRLHIVLIKALSMDYEGALKSIDQYAQDLSPDVARWNDVLCNLHGSRAVLLKLSGEFSRAIQDLDFSLQSWEKMTAEGDYWELDPRVHNFFRICLMEHRAHAKHLIEDVEGSQLDRDFATNLRGSGLVLEPISWEFLNFRGTVYREASLRYSLVQLPVDYH